MSRTKLKLSLILIVLFLLVSCYPKEVEKELDAIEALDHNEADAEVMTVSDGYLFNDRHYHFMEVHEDELFAVCQRENLDNPDDWSDGLWCFSPYKEAELIVEGKGIDFRVCSNTGYIAVTIDDSLKIYNNEGVLVQAIMNDQMLPNKFSNIQLVGWNDEGDRLWCAVMETYIVTQYLLIDPTTMNVTTYDDREFGSDEYVLNLNTGWIAFSDFPVVLDITAQDEYMTSGKITTLSIYNLFTKEEIAIDTAVTNRFKQKWDSDNELVYYKGYKLKSYMVNND